MPSINYREGCGLDPLYHALLFRVKYPEDPSRKNALVVQEDSEFEEGSRMGYVEA